MHNRCGYFTASRYRQNTQIFGMTHYCGSYGSTMGRIWVINMGHIWIIHVPYGSCMGQPWVVMLQWNISNEIFHLWRYFSNITLVKNALKYFMYWNDHFMPFQTCILMMCNLMLFYPKQNSLVSISILCLYCALWHNIQLQTLPLNHWSKS